MKLRLGIKRASTALILATSVIGPPLAFGAAANLTWTTLSSGSYQFTNIDASEDGQKVIAVTTSTNEKVIYSSDGGSTFTNITPARSTGIAASFSAVAISGDGSVAYLTVDSGGPTSGSKVYKTTNFSTWTQLAVGDTGIYRTIATNTDGSVVIIGSGSTVKISADGGSTWPTSSAYGVFGCDISNSGQKMICFGDSSTLKFSNDYGVSWASRVPSGTRYLFEDSAAISGNGSMLYAIWSDYGGALEGKSKVYKSTNDGVTWTEITANLPEAAANSNTGYRNYGVIETSNDGSVVLVGSRGKSTIGSYQSGYLYLSDDSGVSWTKQTGSGTTYWASVATNSNGSKLFGAPGLEYTIAGTIKGAGLSIIVSSSFNSLAIAGNASTATYRVPIQVTANVSTAGRVTFYADGKRIGGCIQRPTSGIAPNIVATCSYSPSKRGAIRISATLDPTDPLATNSVSDSTRILVSNRATQR